MHASLGEHQIESFLALYNIIVEIDKRAGHLEALTVGRSRSDEIPRSLIRMRSKRSNILTELDLRL